MKAVSEIITSRLRAAGLKVIAAYVVCHGNDWQVVWDWVMHGSDGMGDRRRLKSMRRTFNGTAHSGSPAGDARCVIDRAGLVEYLTEAS